MPEAFSFNREFDFVRLDGLRRVTGRPPHEWDLYTVKELIDNALDADETLWGNEPAKFPRLHVRIEYNNIPEPRCRQLFVQVRNRTAFPVKQMEDIFATRWYTSRKAFIKGLTRGSLGNALKTLLGIPYALRNRVAGDWIPMLEPLSILCHRKKYLPRYVVDSTAQTIRFEYKETKNNRIEGTTVSIGVDHFEQEMPRVLAEIEYLADFYHLCNPHAEFHWSVEIDGEEWAKDYAAKPNWPGKFRGIAPVQWYSPTAFQDLLGALYRRQRSNKKTGKLSLKTVCPCFAGVGGRATVATLVKAFGKDALTEADLEGPATMRLYRLLSQHTLRFDSACLGRIGSEHVGSVLSRSLPIEGNVFYESAIDVGDDPNIPFLIEAAVARLKEGKREIWTAINFTPTYGDPFLRRWLRAAIQPDEPVLGLRGLLDAYGLREDAPVVLFLHLICPNIEHNEFSKTEINHLPFKQELVDVLDRLLTTLTRIREDEELRLEQAVFQALDIILGELRQEERFVFDQLLEKLRARLSQDPLLAAWLDRPDALGRMRTYITSYQSRNAVLTHHVVRPSAGTLSIPLHPDRYFSVLADHISPDLIAQHHVNKVLYVQVRELEPVVLENGWLNRMDFALLRNPPGPDGLQEALVQCVAGSELPVLVLHDSDETGRSMAKQMRTWLEERHLNTSRIVDLGLDKKEEVGDKTRPTKLVEMMPGELAVWLMARFQALGIPLKSLPSDADIRQDIRKRFERLLLGHLWEGISEQLEMTRLLVDLDRQLHFTDALIGQALDRRLKDRLGQGSCAESYAMVLDEVVAEFFEDFMRNYGSNVPDLVRAHMGHVQYKWER